VGAKKIYIAVPEERGEKITAFNLIKASKGPLGDEGSKGIKKG